MAIGSVRKMAGSSLYYCFYLLFAVRVMTEGARVCLPFPAPGCSDFLQGPAAMSPDAGFFTQNVRFVSVAFYQAQGMGKVQRLNSCLCRLRGGNRNRGAGRMIESGSSSEKSSPLNLIHPSRKNNVLNNELIQYTIEIYSKNKKSCEEDRVGLKVFFLIETNESV